MIRHSISFRFKEEIAEADRQRILDELTTFPSLYPQMRNWHVGRNISTRDSTFTHTRSIEFDT